MSSGQETTAFSYDRPGTYRIRVGGQLTEHWTGRLACLEFEVNESSGPKGPVTELVGRVRDQAELSGILETLHELHLTLLSVEMLEEENGWNP